MARWLLALLLTGAGVCAGAPGARAQALPPNDECAAAREITTAPFLDSLDTTRAAKEPSEPALSCAATGEGPGVWYRFTPPADGTVCLRTCGSDYDTLLATFVGACSSVIEGLCSDDLCGSQSGLDLAVTTGQAILIEVAADGAGPAGGFLRFTLAYTTDDTDGDGVPDCADTCPRTAAADQSDPDADGVGTPCDSCPTDFDPRQGDRDLDGVGDACDADADGDGEANATDNCPLAANADQSDLSLDGVGDVCQCGDADGSGTPDAADVAALRGALAGLAPGVAEPALCNVRGPTDAADRDGDGLADDCDIVDLAVLRRTLAGRAPGIASVCAGTSDTPVFPGITLATATDQDQVTLAWLPAISARTPPGAIQYHIYLSEVPDFTPSPSTLYSPGPPLGATQAVLTGLNPGTTYHVLITADDGLGNPPSLERDYRTVTTPALPVVLSATTPLEDAADLGLGEPTIVGTTYTYTPAPGATLPSVGALLVGHVGDEGYLRRVDAVTPAGSQIIVETSDASLSEAVEQMSVSSSLLLFDVSGAAGTLQRSWPGAKAAAPPLQVQQSLRPSGARVTRLAWGDRLLVAEQVEHAGTTGSVRLAPGPAPGEFRMGVLAGNGSEPLTYDARVGFEPEFRVDDLAWETGLLGPRLLSAEILATGTLTLDVSVLYDFQTTATYDPAPVRLLSTTYYATYPVGPVLVIQEISFTLDADVQGTATAAIRAGAQARASATVEVGTRFNAGTGGWDPVYSSALDRSVTVQLEVEGSVVGEVRLVPRLETRFYHALAAGLSVEPFVTGQIQAGGALGTVCPPEMSQLDLDLGLECWVSADLSILLWDIALLPPTLVCGPFELPLFSLPEVGILGGSWAGSSIGLSGQITDGTYNPLDRSSIEWAVSPASAATISPSPSDPAQATLTCQEPGQLVTATFSGHGLGGELARRCAEADFLCPCNCEDDGDPCNGDPYCDAALTCRNTDPLPDGTTCTAAGGLAGTCQAGQCTPVLPGGHHICVLDPTTSLIVDFGISNLPVVPTGSFDINCGAQDPGTGKAGCTCSAQQFDPINLLPIGFVCMGPFAGCPPGEIDCDGGNALDVDMDSSHSIGTCTSNADCEAQCAAFCPAGSTAFDPGCEGYCQGGANDELTCTDEPDCPAGGCPGPNGAGTHVMEHHCGCSCLTVGGAPASPGGLQCNLGLDIEVESALPCGDGDAVVTVGSTCIPLTTQASHGIIHNANLLGGDLGGATLVGVPGDCQALASGVTSGMSLVGQVNFYDSDPLGDLNVLLRLTCQ